MALIPDIAAHGLSFMHFFFHMEGGFASVEEFWLNKGVPTVEGAGLGYFEVKELSRSLTASIQWRKIETDCCDVRLALDAKPARALDYPDDPRYQIGEPVFREFFNFARHQKVGGILARYGATLPDNLHFMELPGNARLKRFVVEAGEKPAAITADFSRNPEGRWTLSLEPEKLLRFLDKPVDEFFEGPLKAATILITPLLTGARNEERVTS